MLDSILLKAPVYLLVFVRCFALIMTLPMFSMRAASSIAKVAIAGYMAFFIFGSLDTSMYSPYIGNEGSSSMIYFGGTVSVPSSRLTPKIISSFTVGSSVIVLF